MCSPASCRQCGKTTWAGCGKHAEQVMARVPADRRCDCAPATGSAPDARRSWNPFRR
jgi:hypothetical protein